MGVVKLTIEALPQGGFIVVGPSDKPFEFDALLRAASTLDEALDYVRARMASPAEMDAGLDTLEARILVEAKTYYGGEAWPTNGVLSTEEQIAEAGAIGYRDFKRDMDQGALSREAMTAAVNRRNGATWRA